MDNLFEDTEQAGDDERFDTLVTAPGLRIERIVSRGQSSPAQGWYDQDEHEWVLVLSGSARVRFEDGDRVVDMRPGDHVTIPAHARHRVEWTDPDAETVWVAVRYAG